MQCDLPKSGSMRWDQLVEDYVRPLCPGFEQHATTAIWAAGVNSKTGCRGEAVFTGKY